MRHGLVQEGVGGYGGRGRIGDEAIMRCSQMSSIDLHVSWEVSSQST